MRTAGADGLPARELKWKWIHQGLEAPGAAEKIRRYDGYVAKMEQALDKSEWLAGDAFTLADAALAPYVNRLAALSMRGLWEGGRRPNVERRFAAVSSRPAFKPAFLDWMPGELTREMRANGERSWPDVARLLAA